MWSKKKKILIDFMAESLKGRVTYNFEKYSTRKTHVKKGKGLNKYYSERAVFSIIVDGEVWFASNPMGIDYLDGYSYRDEMDIPFNGEGYWEEDRRVNELAKLEYIKETGIIQVEDCMNYLSKYIYEVSIEDALNGENYFWFLLALLDKRLGKRRLANIVDRIDEEPEWTRKWILLRSES